MLDVSVAILTGSFLASPLWNKQQQVELTEGQVGAPQVIATFIFQKLTKNEAMCVYRLC